MDFKTARSNMVENQIRANKVTNLSVINAFKDVPREKFVQIHYRKYHMLMKTFSYLEIVL